MAMRISINWNVFVIFGVVILGFIVAGFLVSDNAETDDGFPLNIFMWGMAAMFTLSSGGILLWAAISNRRREEIERNWYDAEAEILEVSQTGAYINNQPRLKFKLLVQSPMHGQQVVEHKQVIPLTELAQFGKGMKISVKVNPENPRDIMLG